METVLFQLEHRARRDRRRTREVLVEPSLLRYQVLSHAQENTLSRAPHGLTVNTPNRLRAGAPEEPPGVSF